MESAYCCPSLIEDTTEVELQGLTDHEPKRLAEQDRPKTITQDYFNDHHFSGDNFCVALLHILSIKGQNLILPGKFSPSNREVTVSKGD